jgi:quercetin dioxygenase-like cupin family protein
MTQGARTPEELEALLEDAFVTRDAEALSEMFAEGAVLAVAEGRDAARGAQEIGRVATALWQGGRTYVAELKATAADTGGLMSIVQVTEAPGAEAPLHIHHRDDEGFWILEGDVTFEVGDETIEATAGDYVFGPRGIPHRFMVGDRGCRMLFIMVPGGMEDVIRATSEPAASRTLPPAPAAEPTQEEVEGLKSIIKEFGYELLV